MIFKFGTLTINTEKEPWRSEGFRTAFYSAPGTRKSYTVAACILEPILREGGTIVVFEPKSEWHCVPPETPILLSNGEVITSEEMYDRVLKGRRQVQVVGYKPQEGLRRLPVVAVSKENVSCLIRVKARLGRQITGTPNHKVFAIKDGKPQWVNLRDIRAGDRLLIPRKLPAPFRPLRSVRYKNLRGHGKWLLRINGNYLETTNNTGKISRIKNVRRITSDLARFIACLCADGHVSPSSIWFIDGKRERRIAFATLSKKLFDVEGIDYPDKQAFRINNSALSKYAKRVLGVQGGRKSRTLKIPKLIMRASEEIARAFLGEYDKCDGWQNDISTTSKFAAIQLVYLYERLGMHATLCTHHVSQESHIVIENDGREHNIAYGGNEIYSVKPVVGTHLAFKSSWGTLDSITVEDVELLHGDYEVIGCLIPNIHNAIMGQCPLISHNTLKQKFPVIVVGGPFQDIPLAVNHAKVYAESVVKHGVSMVFDFTEIEDKDLVRFAAEFLARLFTLENVARRTLFLFFEELTEYCPYSVKGKLVEPWVYERMSSRIVKIATQGRSLGINIAATSQRPAQLNYTVRMMMNLSFYGKFHPKDLSDISEVLSAYKLRTSVKEMAEKCVNMPHGSWVAITSQTVTSLRIEAKRETAHGADTPRIDYTAPVSGEVQQTMKDLAGTIKEALAKEEEQETEVVKLRNLVKSLKEQGEKDREQIKEFSIALKVAASQKPQTVIQKVGREEKEVKDFIANLRNEVLETFDKETEHFLGVTTEQPQLTETITDDVANMWLSKLPTPVSKKVFAFLLKHKGMKFTKSQIALQTGYKNTDGGTFWAAFRLLKQNSLAKTEGNFWWVE